VKYISINSF